MSSGFAEVGTATRDAAVDTHHHSADTGSWAFSLFAQMRPSTRWFCLFFVSTPFDYNVPMSGDLLQTKLYVPRLRSSLVPRPHH